MPIRCRFRMAPYAQLDWNRMTRVIHWLCVENSSPCQALVTKCVDHEDMQMKLGSPTPKPEPLLPERRTSLKIPAIRKLWSLIPPRSFLAMLDQSVVSGTRFLTTILIGRLCGPEELGVYSLTFAIYLLIACLQEALISTPYTVFGNRLQGTQRKLLAGSVLVHSLVLSFAAVIAIGGGTAMLWAGNGYAEFMPAAFTLAAVMPFMLLWEFGRRYAIAHLQLHQALILDAATSVIQISGLAWFVLHSNLSTAGGVFALGIGCGCTGLACYLYYRDEFRFASLQIAADWWSNWRFGKWVLGGQIVGFLHGYTPVWVIAVGLGTAATGVFSACENIVLLSNPFILATTNLIGATTAKAYGDGGYSAVCQVARAACLYSAAAMGVLWFVLFFLGGSIVSMLYGDQFSGNGYVVSVIASAAPLWAVSSVMSVSLRAVGHPESDFRSKVLGLVATLIMSLLSVSIWGISGVAYSLVAGAMVSTLFQMWFFYRVIPALR